MRAIGGRDVAVVATAAVLAALLLANGADGAELVGAMAVVAAIVIVWFAVGRGAGEGSPRAITTVVLVVVLSGVGTAISPSMATVQAIGFPLVWTLTRSTRGAVIANVALALSVGTGYFFVIGPGLVAFAQVVVIEIISLAGSFAIGFWISRISVESAERATLLAELRETQEQLASVSRDAGAAGERERLARDIHDTIAQDLTGLVLLAQRTRRELQGGSATVGETLDLLEESARSALAETRSLVATSAPLGLADDGIVGALTRLAERFSRETGIAVLVSGEVPELPRETEVVLLRCAQEGLANVRKHSGAVTATLTLFSRDGSVGVSLSDDGDGFDPRTVREGFGLSGMRARLDLVGGHLEIAGQPGEGTTITASLPLTVGAEK
jgi:signal transduction histidine kinase